MCHLLPAWGMGALLSPLAAGLPGQAAVLAVVPMGCSAWEGLRGFGPAVRPKVNQGTQVITPEQGGVGSGTKQGVPPPPSTQLRSWWDEDGRSQG